VYFSTDEDDATLIRRVLDGETAAFEVLVERYQRVLYTVALRMLGNRDDAKDATQTAFVRAYERLASFDEQYRFFSWIYRILVNECLNVIRGRRPEDELTPVLATSGGPFESAVSRERQAQVQAALLQLTPEYRAVVVLRHFAGLSYEEMADCARRAGKDGEIAPVFGAAAARANCCSGGRHHDSKTRERRARADTARRARPAARRARPGRTAGGLSGRCDAAGEGDDACCAFTHRDAGASRQPRRMGGLGWGRK
jgi:RNA polymerase sigma-70 factor (ECF subfamily)